MDPKTMILVSVISGTLVLLIGADVPTNVELLGEGWHKDIGKNHRSLSEILAASKIDINEFLIGVIENFRTDMITGLPELNVPVLDPFSAKDPVNVDVEDKMASIHGSFSDILVKGMSGFSMESLHADLTKLSLDFHLRMPWMKATGNYSLDGKAFKIAPIRGNGEFWLETFNLTLIAKASLETSNDNHLQLSKDFDVMIDFDKVEIYLEDFLGGGKWTEVILKIINDLSKDIFRKCLPLLKGELNKALLKVINNHLMKLPITSLIPGSTADEYVDQILENTRKYMKDNKLDPMQLPNYISEFAKEIMYVNVTGEAKLHDGWLSGVSTIHRTDDCELNTTRTTISVSAHLGLSNLKLSYKGEAKFMALGPTIVAGGHIRFVEFYFKIHQTNKKGEKPVLDDFIITELSTIWIELSGLGPLTWIWKYLLTGITKMVENFVVIKVTESVRQYVEAEFQKMPFPV